MEQIVNNIPLIKIQFFLLQDLQPFGHPWVPDHCTFFTPLVHFSFQGNQKPPHAIILLHSFSPTLLLPRVVPIVPKNVHSSSFTRAPCPAEIKLLLFHHQLKPTFALSSFYVRKCIEQNLQTHKNVYRGFNCCAILVHVNFLLAFFLYRIELAKPHKEFLPVFILCHHIPSPPQSFHILSNLDVATTLLTNFSTRLFAVTLTSLPYERSILLNIQKHCIKVNLLLFINSSNSTVPQLKPHSWSSTMSHRLQVAPLLSHYSKCLKVNYIPSFQVRWSLWKQLLWKLNISVAPIRISLHPRSPIIIQVPRITNKMQWIEYHNNFPSVMTPPITVVYIISDVYRARLELYTHTYHSLLTFLIQILSPYRLTYITLAQYYPISILFSSDSMS